MNDSKGWGKDQFGGDLLCWFYERADGGLEASVSCGFTFGRNYNRERIPVNPF